MEVMRDKMFSGEKINFTEVCVDFEDKLLACS